MLSILLFAALLTSPADAVKLEIDLQRASIPAQTPATLILRASATSGTDVIRGVSVNYKYLRIGIVDESGKSVYDAIPGPNRCGGYLAPSWQYYTSDGSEGEHLLVLNEWHSLDLPPGKYRVDVDLSKIGILTAADTTILPNGAMAGTYKSFPFNTHWELPLEIVGENDAKVREEYAGLLATALNDSEASERGPAKQILCYSKEPLALPYQLDFFFEFDFVADGRYGFMEDCLEYDLPMRFIESNNPMVAAELVDYLKPMEKSKEEMNALIRHDRKALLVLWTLFELHGKRNPAVTAITAPVVERHDRPSDPRPVPGMD